ncbi:cerebellin-1-like [Sardina pilchardus]|uniref:cerebellin-1-like n=1 Tax=Sardina pilchardus TaxID=27697 RepID=UPI002E0F7644
MRSFIVLLFLHLACREVVGNVLEKDLDIHGQGRGDEDQTESKLRTTAGTSDATGQPDIWAELREMRHVVQGLAITLAEQRVELQHSKAQVQELKKLNTAMEVRLNNEMREIIAENNDVEIRLTSVENEMGNLKINISDTPKVAFSVALTDAGYVGPYNIDITLVYKKIFSNIGNAYSHVTGIFTAPLRGVYYIRFTAQGISASNKLVMRLMKNGQQIMAMYEYPNGNEYVNNAVVLQLEVGDLIYMQLPSSSQTFDNTDNHTTFSGFLIFPL